MQAIPMLISIHSNAHRDEADEDETLTMLTSGVLELDENRAVIRYEETLEEGMPAQRVTVTIENDAATMSRNGDYATDMVFRMGVPVRGSIPYALWRYGAGSVLHPAAL